MDNYQAMNFYYGLLNLHAGLFRANLCENLMIIAQSVPDQPAAAYHKPGDQHETEHNENKELKFGSFYDDGHILHNVEVDTQSDFFLDPTRGDTIKWHVSFTVAKDVRPADQFIVQLSDNLIVAPNGHPQKPIADYVDQDGEVIAMAEYQPDKHQLAYTFTNYVTDHEQIYGEITGELSIDPLTVPETEFGMKCFIAIDNYRRDFTVDADYPDLNNTFLGVSSRMMSFDADKHIFTDLIYVNPAEKKLDHGYIVFNTSEMVEELSNAVIAPATVRIEIFQNARHLKLPQSYGVDLRRLRDITNRFPLTEGDHLVDTPRTISFADNKMRLNLTDDDSTDSYVIRITGQYNDELDGAVRLRARLFGVDESNVYMSNATAATIKGTAMTVSGTAVAKEGHASVEESRRDTLYDEGETVDELASAAPAGSTTTEVEEPEPVVDSEEKHQQTVDEPETEDSASTSITESQAEAARVDESVAELEGDNATDYDRRFAKLLKKNMAKIRRGEKVSSDAEPEPTPEPQEVESAVASHQIEILQPTEVFLPHSNVVSETVASPVVEEENSESTVPASTAAPTEVIMPDSDSVASAEPASAKSTAPAPVVEVTPEEDVVVEPETTNEESTAAPLPVPSRRPPRRVGRFERYQQRSSLRHLRRF